MEFSEKILITLFSFLFSGVSVDYEKKSLTASLLFNMQKIRSAPLLFIMFNCYKRKVSVEKMAVISTEQSRQYTE